MKAHSIKPILIFLMASLLLSNCQPGTKQGTSLVVATPVPLNLPGLVAYYPFNGNADDLSSNHINGQVKNAVLTKDRFGVDKNAYEFNGVDSSITFDASKMPLGNSPRTISAWIKAESYPPEPYAGLGSRATVIGWGINVSNQLSEMQIVNRAYCNKLKLTNLNGLIANILTANKERLNFVFNKIENKGEFSGQFCPLLACF